MNLEGTAIRLRAVEPQDAEMLYAWENDCDVWPVSGTTEPFSREQMLRFVERQLDGGDLMRTGQLRLIVDAPVGGAGVPPADAGPGGKVGRPVVIWRTVGAVDLFEYDPIHGRAGVGILIYGHGDRGCGYAADALETLCRYAREWLRLHQLWCEIDAENEASRGLFRAAGFLPCGVKRDWLWRKDRYVDVSVWQKILS